EPCSSASFRNLLPKALSAHSYLMAFGCSWWDFPTPIIPWPITARRILRTVLLGRFIFAARLVFVLLRLSRGCQMVLTRNQILGPGFGRSLQFRLGCGFHFPLSRTIYLGR